MILQFPPWKHPSHLALVRDWFFPSHAKQNNDVFAAAGSDSLQDMRQRAIDKINLWMFRAGRLPPAMVATAGLTEAILHDEARRNNQNVVGIGKGISESAMQSIYAMAFARFVNGFVDRDVARSHAADMMRDDSSDDSGEEAETEVARSSTTGAARGESSMYAHAATIGMPQKFVDLRHQVTHGDIPSTVYVRKMTEQALEWLRDRWWVKHATGSSDFAVGELEARARIAREAKEARVVREDSAEDTHENEVGRDGQQDNLMEDTLATDAFGANDILSPSMVAATPSRKRKSTVVDDDDG